MQDSHRTELSGEIRLTMRHMTPHVRRLFNLVEEPLREVRHPFIGANRATRRAAEARARRRA
ncbi:hypothetical protein SAMN04488125_13917 [Methylorubrum salsuginis]|uniref:Uncharacterized protein n=1 Tax=Methylorubrum salsuginis TaxID=414703 RepID=A0A1I4MIS7_9HYPH|nr:hypothetical protein SAMN04488125_13917 [Methylorubrum salsuginis]